MSLPRRARPREDGDGLCAGMTDRIHATELKQRGQALTLVTLQNISGELNEKEMEAWQNLIRVLTHEIRNSLTPIASLASTVESILSDIGSEEGIANFNSREVIQALQTIQKRAGGLQQFVDAYRDLTHLPQPQYLTFPARDLIERVVRLVQDVEEEQLLLGWNGDLGVVLEVPEQPCRGRPLGPEDQEIGQAVEPGPQPCRIDEAQGLDCVAGYPHACHAGHPPGLSFCRTCMFGDCAG